MKDHFLLETIWILCSYGAGYSLGSLLITLLLVAWGSGRKRVGVRMALLGTAVLILWIGLILGVETGYRAVAGHTGATSGGIFRCPRSVCRSLHGVVPSPGFARRGSFSSPPVPFEVVVLCRGPASETPQGRVKE